MKNLFLLLLFVSTCLSSGYSQNLVPNPSFENINGDPTHWSWDAYSGADDIDDWYKLGSHGGSPDYFYAGAYWSLFDHVSNFMGSQSARTGSGYIGIVNYSGAANPGFREYVQVQLTSPLVAGQAYEVSVWVSLSDKSQYASDGFGFHLTTGVFTGSGGNQALAFTPTAENATNNFMDNKTGWEQISGSFYASGGEQFLTIGNFKDDANINYYNVGSGTSSGSYLYVDDVSLVTTVILPVELISFNAECNENSVHLDWSTASEINNDYFTIERSTDAMNFETIGTVNGNGNSNTVLNYTWTDDNPANGTAYYRLKQTDFNDAYEYHGIRTLSCEQGGNISVYPNPFEKNFTVQLSSNTTYPVTVEVMDRFGRKVHIQKLETSITKIDLNSLPSNIYFVKVMNETTQIVERIIKTN